MIMGVINGSSAAAGMSPDGPGCLEGINCFALVNYIPGELGVFLDGLRKDLEPESQYPRAHVTVLPPRPLQENATSEQAGGGLDEFLPLMRPFEIVADQIEIFPCTNVVYLSVGGGFPALVELHGRLNHGALLFEECFSYHPHITLAQGLSAEQAVEIAGEASRRWAAYTGPRRFEAGTLTFVQNTTRNQWIDLKEYQLPVIQTA